MKHNREDYEGAAEEFKKWTLAGGRELPGLVTRRHDERALYLKA
jgi:lysozyme